MPVRLIGSPGQRNDIAFAHDLVDGFEAEAAIADKGYDADHLHDALAETGAEVVIPPKRNKQVGGMRRTLFRSLPRVGLSFAFTAAASNLVRLPKLLAA